jgi:hypothetical protein
MAYANQSNNKTKAKFNSYKKECLVVFWVVFSFWCYFYSSPLTLVMDHQLLKFLMESNRLIGN